MSDRVNITFCDLLSLVFIHLRLSGSIGWSWWLVTMPWWLPIVIAALIKTQRRVARKGKG